MFSLLYHHYHHHDHHHRQLQLSIVVTTDMRTCSVLDLEEMYHLKNEFFWNVVPHGFTCLIYKSLTFQAQGIRSIPRFQADPSSTGLAFKWGEWWACKAIDAIANQTDSSNSPEENAWWVSRWAQIFQNSAEASRKASVEMRCAPWLRRSVSCLRARFHCLEETLFFEKAHKGGFRILHCCFMRDDMGVLLWERGPLKSFSNVWYFCEICFRFLICKVWNSETIWNSWMNYSNVSRPRYATWFIE